MITNAGEDVEKLEPSNPAGWNAKGYSSFEGQIGSSLKKLNIELLYDLATPYLGVYPRAVQTYAHTKACASSVQGTIICNNPK